MVLPFRHRIFAILVAMSAVPVVLAVVAWLVSVSGFSPAAGARASLEELGRTAVELRQRLDTVRMTPAERATLERHLASISSSLTLARRAEAYARYYNAGLAIAVALLAGAVLFAAVRLAGHLARQLSRPIDELVGWTKLIREREPLPPGPARRGAPEFEVLRLALRDMAGAMERARDRELEAERLRAFREIARRVAHEIKNPLTAMRIAVDHLARRDSGRDGRTTASVEVLEAETDRLERLAQEFSDFGRLLEGPASDVDVVELLEELGRTAVPEGVSVTVQPEGRRMIRGRYEALRRAFANLLRNAVEAMGGHGAVDVRVRGGPDGMVVTVADHGPGVPAEIRDRLFEPYVTTKPAGTGLGLALVRQTVEAHGGDIAVSETPGGGATFTVSLAQ